MSPILKVSTIQNCQPLKDDSACQSLDQPEDALNLGRVLTFEGVGFCMNKKRGIKSI